MDIKERRFQVFVKTIEHENCVKKIIQLMGGEIVEPECKDKKFFVIKIIHANANIFQQKLKTNNIEFEEAA